MKRISFTASLFFQVLSSLSNPFSLHDLHCIPSKPVCLLDFQPSCIQFLIGACMRLHLKFDFIYFFFLSVYSFSSRRWPLPLQDGVGHNESIMWQWGSS